MGNGKRIALVGFLVNLIIVFLFFNTMAAEPRAYYGQVVGLEFPVLQVRAENGRISTFWVGYKTHLDSRPPFFGDRVKIEYVKDFMRRNAVTRISVLKKD